MRGNQFEQNTDEQVTVLTDGERIEGTLFYLVGSRLSDFLNSPIQQESKFLKIKDPTVTCRRTGEQMSKVPFVMVARDRIVLVMTHKAPADDDQGEAAPAAVRLGREPSPRYFR